jgi:hypothetical protein
MDPSELTGKWLLESIDGRPVTGREIHFQIEGLTISGFDGCNTFGGRLDAPGRIRISQRACEGNAPEFPLRLEDAAAHLRTARRSGDRLDLPLWERPGIASFRRIAR